MKSSPSSGSSRNNRPNSDGVKPSVEFEERVRYSETDGMGIAHNKIYFEWFEVGRTEFCRRKGVPYSEVEAGGIYLVVVEAHCQYKKPLRYDEVFIIRVSLEEATPRKIVFTYELLTKEERNLIASGYTVHLAVNKEAQVASLSECILAKISS